MKKISILLLIGVFVFSCGAAKEWHEKDNSIAAYNAVMPHVNETLSSPQTAVYPSFSERSSHTSKMDDNIYLIESWVDEYGNGREVYFVARIQQLGEREFNLISIEYDEL